MQAGKKDLLAVDEDGSSTADPEPIWLVLTTKKHIVDKKRLKPGKIALPHTLNKPGISICLITVDPQRSFKDAIAHPSFPPEIASQIRVLGISKLKERTKSFEERRRLLDQYDLFMADDRVIPTLPKLLGKIFFDSSKRPMPVSLEGYKPKENGKRVKSTKTAESRRIAEPKEVAREIEKAMSSARVHLSPSVTTAVKVGYSNFPANRISENIQAVVDGMTEKFISKGWRNVKAVHIKGPNTIAFPLWMADELWVEEEDVIEDDQAENAKQIASQKGTKRKGRENDEVEGAKKKKTKLLSDEGFSKEMSERREKLRKAKREARDDAEGAVVKTTSTVVKKDGSKKTKIKKSKVVETAA